MQFEDHSVKLSNQRLNVQTQTQFPATCHRPANSG